MYIHNILDVSELDDGEMGKCHFYYIYNFIFEYKLLLDLLIAGIYIVII